MTNDEEKKPDDSTEEPQAPKKPKEEATEKIFIVPYPKVVFLYPTTLACLVTALWLTIIGPGVLEPPQPIAVILSTIFLGILALNMVVLSVDFPRASSLTLFFVTSTVVLGLAVLIILRPNVIPYFRDYITQIQPAANATFFWIIFAMLFAILCSVKVLVQFDYWEVRRNEILHHHGMLSDLRRYPTAGLQVEKEINDVFEYCLLRSGRLTIRAPGEARAFVLDNVPFINHKEERLTRLLSSVKVKLQDTH